MSAPYACVRDLIYELKGSAGDMNMPDAFNALRYLHQATERFVLKLSIRFQPVIETKQYDPNSWIIDSRQNQIHLPEPMFALSSITDGDGTVIDPAKYLVLPALAIPFSVVQLLRGSCVMWYQQLSPPAVGASQVQATGTWGYHNDYSNAWTNTLDTVQDNPLTFNSAQVTIQSVNGADLYGRTPRFSPGQLIRIDSEFLEVTAVDATTNKLTVKRGANGSSAAQHAQGVEVDVWDAPWNVQQATLRYAAYPYKRRGDFTKSTWDGVVAINLPGDIPPDVMAFLQDYVNGVLE